MAERTTMNPTTAATRMAAVRAKRKGLLLGLGAGRI
jgi:hypothetical protein